MTGPQTEIEIRLWRDEYVRARQTRTIATAMASADALVADYRARYGLPQPEAPDAVWCDEPPFAKDGQSHPCWVAGEEYPCAVHWSEYAMSPLWVYLMTGEARPVPLHGRRVCPIVKPPEPNQ